MLRRWNSFLKINWRQWIENSFFVLKEKIELSLPMQYKRLAIFIIYEKFVIKDWSKVSFVTLAIGKTNCIWHEDQSSDKQRSNNFLFRKTVTPIIQEKQIDELNKHCYSMLINLFKKKLFSHRYSCKAKPCPFMKLMEM